MITIFYESGLCYNMYRTSVMMNSPLFSKSVSRNLDLKCIFPPVFPPCLFTLEMCSEHCRHIVPPPPRISKSISKVLLQSSACSQDQTNTSLISVFHTFGKPYRRLPHVLPKVCNTFCESTHLRDVFARSLKQMSLSHLLYIDWFTGFIDIVLTHINTSYLI